MRVDSKFEIGDSLWMMRDNKVVEITVDGIVFKVVENNIKVFYTEAHLVEQSFISREESLARNQLLETNIRMAQASSMPNLPNRTSNLSPPSRVLGLTYEEYRNQERMRQMRQQVSQPSSLDEALRSFTDANSYREEVERQTTRRRNIFDEDLKKLIPEENLFLTKMELLNSL